MRVRSQTLRRSRLVGIVALVLIGLVVSGCDDDEISAFDSAQATLAMALPTMDSVRRLGGLDAPIPIETQEPEPAALGEEIPLAAAIVSSVTGEPVFECGGGGIVEETCLRRGSTSLFFFTFVACRPEAMAGSFIDGTVEVVVPDPTACETGLTPETPIAAIRYHQLVRTRIDEEGRVAERVALLGTLRGIPPEGDMDGEDDTNGVEDGNGANVVNQAVAEVPALIERLLPPGENDVDVRISFVRPGEESETIATFDDLVASITRDETGSMRTTSVTGLVDIEDRFRRRSREFDAVLQGITIEETIGEDETAINVSGVISTDCVDDIMLTTVEPIVFVGESLCPTSGVLDAVVGARTFRYTFRDGSVDIDVGADGTVDNVRTPCRNLIYPEECRLLNQLGPQ